MLDHLPVSNLINLQRMAALKTMDRKIKELYDEGYIVDADLLLDERIERVKNWRAEAGLEEAA